LSDDAPRFSIPRYMLSFLAVLLFFFVSGACGLLYQVVWTRKLVLLFGTTSYAVSTVLSIFFMGLGFGSLWGGRIADRHERPLQLYGVFEIIIGVWALLFILLVNHGEGLVVTLLKTFDFSRGVGIGLRGVLAALFLFVPVSLMGATLPLLAKYVNREARVQGLRIGALYTLNTFGAVAGCFITGFLLLSNYGYTQTTLLGAAANGLIGVLAIGLSRVRGETKFLATRTPFAEKEEKDKALGAMQIPLDNVQAVLLQLAVGNPIVFSMTSCEHHGKPSFVARFETGGPIDIKVQPLDTPSGELSATLSRELHGEAAIEEAIEECQTKSGKRELCARYCVSLLEEDAVEHCSHFTLLGYTIPADKAVRAVIHLMDKEKTAEFFLTKYADKDGEERHHASFHVEHRGIITLSPASTSDSDEENLPCDEKPEIDAPPIRRTLENPQDVEAAATEFRALCDNQELEASYDIEVGEQEPLASRVIPWVLLAFALSGFSMLALEVLWTRLLAMVFLGTTYAYTTMLTALLCGIAVGSASASMVVDWLRKPMFVLGAVLVLMGAGCLWTASWIAAMPQSVLDLMRDSGGDWSQVVRGKFFMAFVALFLPTFFSGMTFPLVVKAVGRGRDQLGHDVGRLYSANTFGGVLGALAGGYLIITTLGTQQGITFLSALLSLAGLALVWMCPATPKLDGGMTEEGNPCPVSFTRSPSPWTRGIVTIVGVVLFAFLWSRGPEDVSRALNVGYVPQNHKVIHYVEGVEGTVAVTEPVDAGDGTDRVLWINRVQATASIEKGVKMNRLQGVLPLLFDRAPQKVLFMCFGSGITCGTLALSPFERIDAVEISHDVLDAAPLFDRDNLGVLDRPNVKFHIDDGRNYLLTTDEKYDLITFEPMPLALAGVSTFYTQDYYQLCLDRLAPGGLVQQWVPLHSLNPEVHRSLVYTFTTVFPEYCAFFVNADLFLIGSNEPMTLSWKNLKTRLEIPELKAALERSGFLDPIEVVASFLLDKKGVDGYAAGGRLMTDDRPWAEFVAPKLIYERTVHNTLAQIEPHIASPAALLDPASATPEILASIERRHAAHRNDFKGLKAYYGGIGAGDTALNAFLESLTIDPNNYNAQYYVRQLLGALTPRYLQWNEPEKAIVLLERALAVMPTDPELLERMNECRSALKKLEEETNET
jgi:spermidine synthase/MFS family permease